MGDGALVEFPSVVGALQCAVDIQRELATGNDPLGERHKLSLRIGIHVGNLIVEGEDIYGDGVNVAARLQGIAQSGGVVLSQQVYDNIGSNVPMQFI